MLRWTTIRTEMNRIRTKLNGNRTKLNGNKRKWNRNSTKLYGNRIENEIEQKMTECNIKGVLYVSIKEVGRYGVRLYV